MTEEMTIQSASICTPHLPASPSWGLTDMSYVSLVPRRNFFAAARLVAEDNQLTQNGRK